MSPRRTTTIQAVLDVKQAKAALQSLGRTVIPLTGSTGGRGGGGGGSAMQGDRGWRTGFGAQQAFQSGPFASYGVGGFVTNTAMFAAAGALSRVITQFPEFVLGLEATNVALQRTAATGERMASSYAEFDSFSRAYQTSLTGFVTAGEAAENVTRLLALGYANSRDSMMEFVQASRAAQLSTGRTAESIEQNLILALANADQSVGRIDQLGISMSQLNEVVKDLRSENSELTLGEARRIGILQILNERFVTLEESGELAASGVESLRLAFRDLREELATGRLGDWIGDVAVRATGLVGTSSIDTVARQTNMDDVAAKRAYNEMGWFRGLRQEEQKVQAELMKERLEPIEAQIRTLGEIANTIGDPDMLKGAEGLYQSLMVFTDVPLSDIEEGIAELQKFGAAIYQRDQAILGPGGKAPGEAEVIEFTASLDGATSKIWKVAEAAVAGGSDFDAAMESYVSSTDSLRQAHEYYQQAVQDGTLTEEQARMGFSLMVESETDIVASALQTLSSSAMQAAAILGGFESSMLGGMVSSATQALSLGGDPLEILGILTSQERFAEEGQSQLDELIAGGEDSVAVASLMLAQFMQAGNADMKAYQDQLREAQKVTQGIDRTNEILSKQQSIWSDFMDKFSKIPGLMSPSDVTSDQMRLSEKGLYRDMPDEWLRRLKDEVFNGVDWENIDPGAIFGKAGLSGWDPESAYNEIESMYQSKELFSLFDPNEIFGPEAIQAIRDGLDKAERALAGEKRFQSFLAAVFGDQDEIQAGVTLGIVDPVHHAWDQAMQGMTKSAAESNTGVTFVQTVVKAIEDGTIRAALLGQLTVSEEELAAGIGGTVVTYDNQSADANVTP